MNTAHIAELLEPFLRGATKDVCHSDGPQSGKEESAELSPTQLQGISIYIDLLQHWNARINLTAIRNEEEIVTRHFGESLFAARHLFPGRRKPEIAAERRQNAAHGASRGVAASEAQAAEQRKKITLADIGPGAGFPGIPIKLWAPEISLTLIESNHKKATFLREAARALTLTDINIRNVRAEALAGETFDVVTLRAVDRFDSILPVAESVVAPTGRLGLLIGSAQYPSAQTALTSFRWELPVPVPGSQSRLLAIASCTR